MSDPSPFDEFDVPAEEEHTEAPRKQAAQDHEFQNAPAPETEELDFGADNADDFGHMNGAPSGSDHPDPFAESSHADPSFESHDQPLELGAPAPTQSSDAFGLSETKEEQEDLFAPSALSLWEQERKNILAQRIAKAKEEKQKAIDQGKADIDSFYQQRADTLKKTQAANRGEEKETRTELEALMKNGTLWEKVAKMANLQPKAGDLKTARMRKLLIQLKTDKVDADGVSKAKK
jgi:hypothetical protein